MGHNFFEGTIPCTRHPEPSLTKMVLSQNLLKGSLPGCLFTAAPKLKSLSLDYLELSSTIPVRRIIAQNPDPNPNPNPKPDPASTRFALTLLLWWPWAPPSGLPRRTRELFRVRV